MLRNEAAASAAAACQQMHLAALLLATYAVYSVKQA